MSHTVVTTTTTTRTSDGGFLNVGYIRTTGGILKISQMVRAPVTAGREGWASDGLAWGGLFRDAV